ncbi:uncharacterized protein [Physcomitrium patens]|uniref:uncharacterized protein isoform X1 n=1 Tax=Physcomitrium patens TaxID=3218 RepID=UPI000D1635A6|nr:uncharacterized protein LOC112276835 isoform X3 [Physcomitrium patens]|eukprot:XP_024364352.1 uncharacterized protein LOC112276835 isoform X3 [Physcomitrella patens]
MRAFMPAEADAPSIQALQSERDVLQGSLFFLSFSRGLYSAPCSSEPAAAQPLTILFRCALFQLLLSVQTLLFVLHSPKLHFPAISSGAQVGSINSPDFCFNSRFFEVVGLGRPPIALLLAHSSLSQKLLVNVLNILS